MSTNVVFKFDDIEIKVAARMPTLKILKDNPEGIKTITVNNALFDIEKTLGIDLRKVKENIREYAFILY